MTKTTDAKTMPSTAFARNATGAFETSQPVQGLSAKVDGAGAHIDKAEADWKLGLHVTRVGRIGAMRNVDVAPPIARKERIEIARGEGVTEWFSQATRGLEHGVDVAMRPAGDAGELVVEVATEGLTADSARDASGVVLRDWQGRVALNYAELVAMDADGHTLPAKMRVAGGAIELHIRDVGAQYPISIDPIVWSPSSTTLTGTLAGSPLSTGAAFGASVAIDGTTAILTAPGAAYAFVFTESGSSWTQTDAIENPDATPGTGFGSSVAISGTTAIVGAASTGLGAAYVFSSSGSGSWVEQGSALLPPSSIGDESGFAISGSVAINGSVAIIGAFEANSAFVYAPGPSGWTLQSTLTPSDGTPTDRFGCSVAVSGTTAVIGASNKGGDSTSQGAAYVFVESGTTWAQQGPALTLVPPAGDEGGSSDWFGWSVAISGTTFIAGAPNGNAAYVFVQSGTTWAQSGPPLSPSSVPPVEQFGGSVAISGSRAIIGTTMAENEQFAFVFAADGTAWTQQGTLTPPVIVGNFGSSVAISGTSAIVGGPAYSSGASDPLGAGSAFAYVASQSGDSCTTASDCLTGFCADGVCCDRACSGQCEACAEPGSVGTCEAVAGVPRSPRTDCAGDGSSSCGGQCDGIDAAACTFPSAGTSCGGGCTGGSEQLCDGAGVCLPAAVCPGNFACGSATACRTTCIADADCATGLACTAGACVPVPSPTCSADGTSSIAGVDGGVTTSCAPYRCGSDGACIVACTTGSDCIAGYVCTEAACVRASTPTCTADRSGSSSAANADSVVLCSPYLCGAGGVCETSCATTADCAADFQCNDESPKACVPIATAGMPPASSKGGCGVVSTHGDGGAGFDACLLVGIAVSIATRRRARATS